MKRDSPPILDLRRKEKRRWAHWRPFAYAAVVLLLAGAGYFAAVYCEWDRLWDVETDMDARSGDLRYTRYVLSLRVSQRVSPTDFGVILRERGLGGQPRNWQPVFVSSIVRWHAEGHFRYSAAASYCHLMAGIYRDSKLPQDRKDLLIRKYATLLSNGDIHGFWSAMDADADDWFGSPTTRP